VKLHHLLPICLVVVTGTHLLLLDIFRYWVSHDLGCFVVTTGIAEVLADPAVQKFRGLGCSQTYRIFRLVYVLLTEGGILDPSCGI